MGWEDNKFGTLRHQKGKRQTRRWCDEIKEEKSKLWQRERQGISIDLIVTRPLIAHLSLYTRLKPTCDKKIGIMHKCYIIQGVTGKFQDCASKNRTGFAIYKSSTVV